MGGRRWERADDIYLAHYAGKQSTDELAVILGRTYPSITRRVHTLQATSRWKGLKKEERPERRSGHQPKARNFARYTEEEDAFIVLNFVTLGATKVAERLGRSYPSVRMRYFYLKKDEERFTRLRDSKKNDDKKEWI